jgi:CRISPR/Cas system-associated exonuclease Cas4 (RecB family)
MSDRPRYDLYLSYSGRKTYLICPSRYRFRYIQKIPPKIELRSTGFGSSIGKVFEWFYERKVWMSADVVSATLALVEPAVRLTFERDEVNINVEMELFHRIVDDVKAYVPSSIESIRKHQLLSESSCAEMDLTTTYTKDGIILRIGGRADFVHGSDKSIRILDGKGSAHREKFVDSEQLIWYAVQYYLKFKVAPSHLGFLYYRFPNDPIQWIDFDAQALRDSVKTTFDVAKKIQLKMFDPQPNPECARCDYQGRCEEGRKYVAARKVEGDGRINSSIFDLESL